MATRVIDDTKLQNIAVAIQAKDNGGQMTVDEMPGRIEAIPTSSPTVPNPALVLWDWEGTKLAAYSREDALALTELPAPDTLPAYAGVDHDFLIFKSWTRPIVSIKTWIKNHNCKTLHVGAVYDQTDRQNHNYWNSPRLDIVNQISGQKRGTTYIANAGFYEYYALKRINILDGTTNFPYSTFNRCTALKHINVPDSVKTFSYSVFSSCYSLQHICLPENISSVDGTVFTNCFSLKQINLPKLLPLITDSMFANCYSLEQIDLPENITSIGDNAFASCYSLAQIDLPENITSIGTRAFMNCYTLCDILLRSKPVLSNVDSFAGLPSNYRVYVPRADLSWFETATNWSTIYTQGNIVVIEDYIEYLESIGFNVDKYKEAA